MIKETEQIYALRDRILASGEGVSRDEALSLAAVEDLDTLCDAANELRIHFCGSRFDTCSIINARSGLCGEDCKWCAQATRHHSGCDTYNFVDPQETLRVARLNEDSGVRRFSLVTSGRRVTEKDLPAFCDMYRTLGRETGLSLCASMGLLSREEMDMLRQAGVTRYHCNLETSESFFPTLCTSHTPADKKRTIAAARQAGLQVCSGGIIGMGESMADRVDLALELRDLGVDSVPVNILNPIPGTPLENQPLISEDEVIRTIAVFRFLLPKLTIRFAGGRRRLSRESTLRILRGGINGAIVGDLLTSIGNTMDEDRELLAAASFTI